MYKYVLLLPLLCGCATRAYLPDEKTVETDLKFDKHNLQNRGIGLLLERTGRLESEVDRLEQKITNLENKR